jgi:hypothetical protein
MKIIYICQWSKVSRSGAIKRERYGNPGAAGKGEAMSKMPVATHPHGRDDIRRVRSDLG